MYDKIIKVVKKKRYAQSRFARDDEHVYCS